MSFNIENFKDILKQEFPGAHYEDGKLTRNEPVTCTIISKDLDSDPHYHEHIELIYVTNSELEADVNKKKIMVRSGDMLVLIPGDVHNYKLRNNCSYACIHADIDFLFSGILSNSDLHYSMPYTLAKKDEARVFRAAELDKTEIPKLIYGIFAEYKERHAFYKLAIRSDLSKIALYVFRKWNKYQEDVSKESTRSSGKSVFRLSEVLDLIDSEYMKALTAEQMASRAGMSYSYFSRFFKNSMGHTFSEYLNLVRIKASEKLLINTDLPISDIATAVGFSNTSYFISQFKKQLHITPKRYRTNFGND